MAALTFAAAMPFAAHAVSGGYIGAEAAANESPAEDFRLGGGTTFNNKTHTGFMLGLNTGYAFDFGLRPEFALNFRNNMYDTSIAEAGGAATTGGATGHLYASTALVNMWYDFRRPTGLFKDLHPYIGAGTGLAHVQMSLSSADLGGKLVNDSRDLLAYQGGAGLSYDLSPNVTASLDYRYLMTNKGSFQTQPAVATATGDFDGSSRYRSQSLGLGLRISFAAPPAAPAAPAPLPVAAVAPPPPPPPPPPPIDSDGDGVPDGIDKCPNTPMGFKVDAEGCIIQQTIVMHAVNFKTNSDQLTDADKASLDPIVAALQSQPSLRVEIDGYTDSRGSPAYNLALSDKRAKSVKTYLVSKGADGTHLTSHGFGETKPIASNDTDDGRAQNRRVEFVVLGGVAADTNVRTTGSTAAAKASAEDQSKPASKKKTK